MRAAVTAMRGSTTAHKTRSMLVAWHAWAGRARFLERNAALQVLGRYRGAAFAAWRHAAVRQRIKRLQWDVAHGFDVRMTELKVNGLLVFVIPTVTEPVFICMLP